MYFVSCQRALSVPKPTRVRVECDEGDIQRFGLLLGADGRGDRYDVLQLAALQQLPKTLHCVL